MRKSIRNSNLEIEELDFNDLTPEILKSDDFYSDWPVVYVLNNDSEMYIGETYHAQERMKQHLKNPDRRRLKKCNVFASKDFTKSATLDIESSLIELCSSDNIKTLQNANPGLVKHNYANKQEFAQDSKMFTAIWQRLKDLGLVETDIETLKNKDLFKYSPYKSLNAEQCTTRDYIVENILEAYKENRKQSIFVNGSAGTGKTILALYLLKLFVTGGDYINDDEQSDTYQFINNLKQIINIKGSNLKVGYVVAMTSFRNTLQSVIKEMAKHNKQFKNIKIMGPADVTDTYYDILIVDEAHRLKQTRALGADIGSFYKTNEKLGFNQKDGNQLDWILKQSKIQILFYDATQSIKPCDIDENIFNELIKKSICHNLTSQMRCMGGNDYIKYVKDILNESQNDFVDFAEYDFRLFKNIDDFANEILEKEQQYKLCRIVAGYGFEWISKNNKKLYDINIDNRKFQWNNTSTKWPISIEGSRVIEEVGCIHTIQGYDCNYCGVVFGPEIYYDGKHIRVDKNKYYDSAAKKTIESEEELLDYIKNIYSVLLTRGIKGTYVYVCDEKLRNYLAKYIKVV